MSGLPRDTRGLALGIVTFFGMLLIFALLYIVFTPAFDTVNTIMTSQAESTGATDQISLAQTIKDNLAYVAIFLAMLFLIGRAVREGSRT